MSSRLWPTVVPLHWKDKKVNSVDPLLLVAVGCAIVLIAPYLKGIWKKINSGDEQASPIQQQGATLRPDVVVNTQVEEPVTVGPTPSECLNRMIAFARCLPPEDGKQLVTKHAADFVLREVEQWTE